MPGKTITLPAKEEMLQRLLKVEDDIDLQECFYPKLLEEAGRKRGAPAVVMLLLLAIDDYTKGMPILVIAIMNRLIPDFINALIPDEEVAKEARAFFEEVEAAKLAAGAR